MIRRRGILQAAAGLLLAPAVVRAEAIMPVRSAVVMPEWPPLPVGTILYQMPGLAVPRGWLAMDGRPMSPGLFPELARVLGSRFLHNGMLELPAIPPPHMKARPHLTAEIAGKEAQRVALTPQWPIVHADGAIVPAQAIIRAR